MGGDLPRHIGLTSAELCLLTRRSTPLARIPGPLDLTHDGEPLHLLLAVFCIQASTKPASSPLSLPTRTTASLVSHMSVHELRFYTKA